MNELDEKLRDILREFNIPDWALEPLRMEVEVAIECARDNRHLALPKAQATKLFEAAQTLLSLGAEYNVTRETEVAAIRALGNRALERLAIAGKPITNPWLAACSSNFHKVWEDVADYAGMYHWDGASKALAFVTRCCRLVDPDVNEHAVFRAYKEFEHAREMTLEEYKEFWQSESFQKPKQSAL